MSEPPDKTAEERAENPLSSFTARRLREMGEARDRELYFAITGLEDPSAQQAAEPPTLLELADRIAARGAYTGPSSAQIIRADRDAR